MVTKLDDETIEVIDRKTDDDSTGHWRSQGLQEAGIYAQLLLYYYAILSCTQTFPSYHEYLLRWDAEGKPDPYPFSMCFGPEDERRFLDMLKNRVEIRNVMFSTA